MESNNKSNNGGDEHGQLRGSAKLNEVTNDDDVKPTAAVGEDQQKAEDGSNKKSREDGNDLDLELENLSREELIKLVKQQQQQLESAKQNNTKNGGGDNGNGELAMDMKLRSFVDSDINAIELRECKEQLAQRDSLVQELSQQINQLKENQELRKEMEVNANGKRMKVQLPLENWVDLFGFVPRRQLVQLLPQIDDRHFAKALQYFLQKVGKITLGYLEIVPPEGNDTNGRPMVYKGGARLDLADTQMPENIKNFGSIQLRYLDISVINFLRHFQQNSLLQNVNLELWLWTTSNKILLPFLTHVLPLIDSIESIRMWEIPQLSQIGDSPPPAENNNELIQTLLNTMMAQPRILQIYDYGSGLEPDELDWCCNWLYNTPRNDGRLRMLNLVIYSSPNDISSIVERIKQDFVMAYHPISFFICIYVYDSADDFQWHQDISLENGRTNEKMVVREVQTAAAGSIEQMLISRHPHEASKQWIEQNEKEILELNLDGQNRNISMNHLTQIAI